MKLKIFVVSLLIFVSALFVSTVDSTQIEFDGRAYSNIVVAVSPDIPNTQARTIINNLQFMIRKASSVLYRATRQKAYIRDVRILIPESWNNIQSNISTWETFNKADIQVAPPSSIFKDKPYTVQSGGCGHPGEYIHFTPNYLMTLQEPNNVALYGPPEKVFVREWAHLRYGVFDEYGQAKDRNYPLFYRPQGSSSAIVPNLCTNKPPIFTVRDSVSQGPCKIDPKTGLYDDRCVYDLLPQFDPISSLMSNHSINSVVDFCEDDQDLRHVYDAPTKHNVMCNSKSVWTVISSHPDFTNLNPPIGGINAKREPTFSIVKSSGSRFVLVADVSGSMKDFNRIQRLYESSRRWIKYDIADGSQLGMVQFNSGATVLSKLVLIDGDASRSALIDKLPRNAVGGTCIGCGLQKALEVLSPGGKGGVILLLTDGEETDKPFINQVLPSVIQSGARVVSIAFGRTAEDKIEDLAEKTNGKSFFVDDNDTSQGLNDAFIGSLTFQPAVSSDHIVVLLFQHQYQNILSVTESFYVDASVGRNFNFRVDYTQRTFIQSFSLRAPDGTIYNNQLQFDDTAKVAQFKLPLAQVGQWRFTLKLSNSKIDSVAIKVTAQTRSDVTTPITTECYVPDGTTVYNATASPVRILAKVMQGSNPVLRAKVKAYIGVPNGAAQVLELFDNGLFADTNIDDGIYSRYFIQAASSIGRYTVECQVYNDDGSAYVINNDFITNRLNNSSSIREISQQGVTQLGAFSRTADGGSFKVSEITDLGDVYPPSKVLDLSIVDLRDDNKTEVTVTINFTAPGDDLDTGKVLRYEVRYSPIFEAVRDFAFDSNSPDSVLVDETTDLVNGSLQPLESGGKQSAAFNLILPSNKTMNATTYYVALRAVDNVGHYGPASNVASLQLASREEEELPVEQQPWLTTKVIIAIAVGSVLAVALIIAIILLVIRRKYQSYRQTETNPNKA